MACCGKYLDLQWRLLFAHAYFVFLMDVFSYFCMNLIKFKFSLYKNAIFVKTKIFLHS